jgi:hypothetical protein
VVHRSGPAIGRIETGTVPGLAAGTITEFTAGLSAGSIPNSIARNEQGNLMWFTADGSAPGVGMVAAGTDATIPAGTITEFSQPPNTGCTQWQPAAMVAGAAGDMWFTDTSCMWLWNVSPDGSQFTNTTLPTAADHTPISLTLGPLGNLWYADAGTAPNDTSSLNRFDPSTRLVATYSQGLNPGSSPTAVRVGPDGNIWFTDHGSTPAIGAIGSGTGSPSVLPPSVFGSAQANEPQVCSGDRWAIWDGFEPTYEALAGSFQWLLDGTPIAGASNQTYAPTTSEVGHQLSCTVQVIYGLLEIGATATSGAVTVTSNAAATGLAGTTGTTGSAGTAGVAGPAGMTGPAGTLGAQAPSSRDVALMSCSSTTKRVKGGRETTELCVGKLFTQVQHVTCTTTTKTVDRRGQTNKLCASRLVGGTATLTIHEPWTATLSRAGILYGTGLGNVSGRKLNLVLTSIKRELVPGGYTLRLQLRRKHSTQAVPIH